MPTASRSLWLILCLACPALAQDLKVRESEAFDLPDGAMTATLEVSPDGKAWWCEGSDFNPDGPGFIKFVVQNGKRGPTFSDHWVESSKDGRQVLSRGDTPAGRVLVLDGKQVLGPASVTNFELASTGRWAAVVQRDEENFLVVDGKEEKIAGAIQDVAFSPDGSRLAYRVTDRDKGASWVVVDGKKQKEYRETSWLSFSDDSKHLVYPAALDKNKWVAVIDGVEKSAGHHAVYRPRLSGDGKRFAFIAVVGNDENCAVIDGVEGKVYKRLNLFEPPMFSPDGAHHVYPASAVRNQVFMVHNGAAGKPYANATKAVFSPDGKRLAYWGVHAENKVTVVLDGAEIATVETGSTLTFSPDSKTLAYLRKSKDGWSLVYDGAASPAYKDIARRIHFTGPSRGHVFAVKERKVVKVEFGG